MCPGDRRRILGQEDVVRQIVVAQGVDVERALDPSSVEAQLLALGPSTEIGRPDSITVNL
jgi:hypothetical protein